MESRHIIIEKLVSSPDVRLVLEDFLWQTEERREYIALISVIGDSSKEETKQAYLQRVQILIDERQNITRPVKVLYVRDQEELAAKRLEFENAECIHTTRPGFIPSTLLRGIIDQSDNSYPECKANYCNPGTVLPPYQQRLLGVASVGFHDRSSRTLKCEQSISYSDLLTMKATPYRLYDVCTGAGDDILMIDYVLGCKSEEYIINWYKTVQAFMCNPENQILNDPLICLIMAYLLPYGTENFLEQTSHPQKDTFNIYRTESPSDPDQYFETSTVLSILHQMPANFFKPEERQPVPENKYASFNKEWWISAGAFFVGGLATAALLNRKKVNNALKPLTLS